MSDRQLDGHADVGVAGIEAGAGELVRGGTVEDIHCPVCATGLAGDVVTCPRCDTPHHRDCWDYVGGCAVFGCVKDMVRMKRGEAGFTLFSTLASQWQLALERYQQYLLGCYCIAHLIYFLLLLANAFVYLGLIGYQGYNAMIWPACILCVSLLTLFVQVYRYDRRRRKLEQQLEDDLKVPMIVPRHGAGRSVTDRLSQPSWYRPVMLYAWSVPLLFLAVYGTAVTWGSGTSMLSADRMWPQLIWSVFIAVYISQSVSHTSTLLETMRNRVEASLICGKEKQ